MILRITIGMVLGILASGSASLAADPRYPDWPCTQAKVPEISLAAVWAGPPLDDIRNKWKDDAKVGALVARLAARRTPLEEAQKAITEYLAASAEKATAGKLLFAGLFDALNAQRSSVMNGLERVTRKQREAAEKIRADTLALQALQGAWRPTRPGSTSSAISSSGRRDLRGPPAGGEIRLRGADRDRPAAVCARPHHPAGNGIAEPASPTLFALRRGTKPVCRLLSS